MSGILDVSKALKAPGQRFALNEQLELPEMEFMSDPVRFDKVTLDGEYLSTDDDRISVQGTARAWITSRCDRCLEPMQLEAQGPVDAVYAREPDPDDPDLYSYDSSRIDLTDAVRDAILMELPLRFLCREDCKGLCPVCGVNLNNGTCTCQEGAEFTNPFSALKTIVLNNEEV